MKVGSMSNLKFAPGETTVRAAAFSPSVTMFWLKTEIAATNTRVVTRAPNTLLGVIPLGYRDNAYPLSNIASAGVDVKFSLGRGLFGLFLAFVAFGLIDNPLGWILLLVAVSMVLNAVNATLTIQNNGGAVSGVRVSILERAKLEQLRDDINNVLFTDQAGLRHGEMMDTSRAALQAQQAQAAMMAQQQWAQPPVPQPGAHQQNAQPPVPQPGPQQQWAQPAVPQPPVPQPGNQQPGNQ